MMSQPRSLQQRPFVVVSLADDLREGYREKEEERRGMVVQYSGLGFVCCAYLFVGGEREVCVC